MPWILALHDKAMPRRPLSYLRGKRQAGATGGDPNIGPGGAYEVAVRAQHGQGIEFQQGGQTLKDGLIAYDPFFNDGGTSDSFQPLLRRFG